MATRFYFSSTATAPVSPGFAAWNRTTEAVRLVMSPVKDGSSIGGGSFGGGAAATGNATICAMQLVSEPMQAGIVFTTSDTIKAQALVAEGTSNANLTRQPLCLKVYSQDGATLRATLMALGNYGPSSSEWNTAASPLNRTFADGDALSSGYTTVVGDRLVLEVGGQVAASGSAVVSGTISFGNAAPADLGENQTDASGNPWFEISTNVLFGVTLTGQSMTASRGDLAPSAGSSIGLSGQSMTAAGGTITNGLVLTGQAITSASYNSFFSGTQRVYLSWAQLKAPASTITSAALTGQAMTSASGTLVAGTKRAYLSWTKVLLPPSSSANITLTGQSAAAAIGSMTPIAGGTTQQLTGQAVTFSGGTVVGGATPLLTGAAMTMTPGTLKSSDETLFFLGTATPLIAVSIPVPAMQMQSGFLGVLIDGATAVTLVGQPFAAVSGSTAPTNSPALLGSGLNLALGATAPLTEIAQSGYDLTLDSGALTGAVGDVFVRLTGQRMDSALGTFNIDANWVTVTQEPGGVWTNITKTTETWTNA